MRRLATILLTFILATLSMVAPSQSSNADNPSNETGTILDVGGYHACAITVDSKVKCWGGQNASYAAVNVGQTSVPADLGRATDVSSGVYWSCAINAEQFVRCWGQDFESTQVPNDLGKVLQISARGRLSCAITIQKLARCWGYSIFKELDVPNDLGKVKQISGGYLTVCVVTENSLVRCWGHRDSSFGKLNVPADLGEVTSVSVGDLHACALKITGYVRCWGSEGYEEYNQTIVPADLGIVKQIQSGGTQTCAITEADSVRCWGTVGTYSGGWSWAPAASFVPSDLGRVKLVSVGGENACAVTILGDVRCWGSNNRFGYNNVPSDLGKLYTPGPMPLGLAPTPQLSGSKIIGSFVVALPGSWDAGVTFAYQWLRDGFAIPSATSSSYILQASDYLKKISVAVTGSKEGYISDTKTSDAVIPVKPNEKIASLRFTGTLKVGEKAYVAPVNRNAKFDYSYQWLRDGIEIAGATSRTYLMGSADLGSNLSAKVCALYLKDVSHCVSQDAGSTVTLGVLKNVKANISGVAKVGRMLNSTPVIFDKQATVSYQWLRNGEPILDATKNSYFAGVLDKGSSISLRVTVSKPGYETVVKTSNFKLVS